MPRPRKPPRLWFDEERGTWCILDGARKIRTGCARGDTELAEQALRDHLADKYEPPASGKRSAEVLLVDALLAYAKEHRSKTADSERTKKSNLRALAAWAGEKTIAQVTAQACRDYAVDRSQSSARRELETLSAVIRHWHKEHGPLDSVPVVTLPEKGRARERYLTRQEAARLLAGALGWDREGNRHLDKRRPHVARFIILGLYTGSRHRTILGLHWKETPDAGWIDLEHKVLHRRGIAEVETSKRRPKIRIGRRLLTHLSRWHRLDRRLNTGPATVVHYEGKPFADKLRKAWTTTSELSGIDVTPHVLRHTRATWMMQRGDDPYKAAGFLGMSMKMLLDTYGHHHPDFQDDVAN